MIYYYLAASLPTLVLGDPPPVSMEVFLVSSATVLSPQDQVELDLLLAGRAAEGSSRFARQWQAVDTQLRNAVARLRGQRLGQDVKAYLHEHEGYDVSLQKGVTDAFTKPNPLERELALDRCRWSRLDDLAGQAPFGLSAILAFAVKLQITERWTTLLEDVGKERVEALLESNLRNEGTLLKQDKE
jgi:hypothetical protein